MKRSMIHRTWFAMPVLLISALLFACQQENMQAKPDNRINTANILINPAESSKTDVKSLTKYQSSANTTATGSGSIEKSSLPEVDIHTAVMKNDMATVKKYIADQSDLNKKETFGGSTPLIIAALFDRAEIARLLIAAGAKLNVQNNDGSTALITAAFFCRTEIVQMLLAEHADKKIKNKYGQTAYDTVSAPFKDVKPVYDMIGSALAPMGLKPDYRHIEKTRPVIAVMLK